MTFWPKNKNQNDRNEFQRLATCPRLGAMVAAICNPAEPHSGKQIEANPQAEAKLNKRASAYANWAKTWANPKR